MQSCRKCAGILYHDRSYRSKVARTYIIMLSASFEDCRGLRRLTDDAKQPEDIVERANPVSQNQAQVLMY